jgi:hypothetical protein
MVACISGQHVPAFESLWAFKFHLPVIIVTGSENRDTPIPRLVMEHVLNGGDNLSLIGNMSGIVQFNDDCHSGFYSTDRESGSTTRPTERRSLWNVEQIRLRFAICWRYEIAQPYAHKAIALLRAQVYFFSQFQRNLSQFITRFW